VTIGITLAESAELSQDQMYRGIVETFLKVSPMLQRYPFMEIEGNSLYIPREDPDDMGNVGFVGVGGEIISSEAGWTHTNFNLYQIFGQADVPGIVQKTRSNVVDQMAAQVKVKAKKMAYAFESQAIYGTEHDAQGFAGLHSLTVAGQRLHASVTADTVGGPLTLHLLNQLVDLIMGGPADVILMNRAVRRRLSEFLAGKASYRTERDDYGNYFGIWNETPIVATDHIVQTELLVSDGTQGVYSAMTGGTGTSATSSVFAIRFGEGDGLTGIQNGGITTEVFDRLESYSAVRTRLEWFVGQALYSPLAIARIDGVTDAAMTA